MGADLVNMHLIRKFNNGVRFLLCGIDIYSKYVWAIPLKGKKRIAITNAFRKISKESNKNQTKYGQIKAVNFTVDQ